MHQATTRIWTSVDFQADGKQDDFLRLPYSSDLSAYGSIPIPIICVKNGIGPTALLVAGSHGDEYEGQVALLNLARKITPEEVRGRIIILPALNFPAVAAGRRLSPLDEGNLNRLFPGNPVGTPTQMIAHYVCSVLLPFADFVVDLHSGGRSLQYVPSVLVRPGRSETEHHQLVSLMKVFGAPFGCVTAGAGGGGPTTLAAAAQEQNVLALTTELGGGALLSPHALRLAEEGLLRLLKHFGIVPAALVEPAPSTRIMTVIGRDAYVYARSHGIFEPAADAGDRVNAGDLAGRVHSFERPGQAPETLYFASSGIIACRRALSFTAPGDCLFKVMEEPGDLPLHNLDYRAEASCRTSPENTICAPSLP